MGVVLSRAMLALRALREALEALSLLLKVVRFLSLSLDLLRGIVARMDKRCFELEVKVDVPGLSGAARDRAEMKKRPSKATFVTAMVLSVDIVDVVTMGKPRQAMRW